MLYHRCTDVTVSNIRCPTILKSNCVPAYILFSLKTSRSYCSVRTLKIQVSYWLLSRKKSSNSEAGSIRRFNLKKILQ